MQFPYTVFQYQETILALLEIPFPLYFAGDIFG